MRYKEEKIMVKRLISKKVRVLDCKAGWPMSKQGKAYRFDSPICKVRVEKGKRGALELLEDEYHLGTIFIEDPPPRKKQ